VDTLKRGKTNRSLHIKPTRNPTWTLKKRKDPNNYRILRGHFKKEKNLNNYKKQDIQPYNKKLNLNNLPIIANGIINLFAPNKKILCN
jgi:hypothetical protein